MDLLRVCLFLRKTEKSVAVRECLYCKHCSKVWLVCEITVLVILSNIMWMMSSVVLCAILDFSIFLVRELVTFDA